MSTELMRGPHRETLIAATVAEFAEAGYAGASLNRIIRAAGISKSSFYHAIGSKAELLDVVVEHLAADVRSRWEPPAPASFAGPDFWPRVGAMADDLAVLAAEDPALALLGRIIHLPGAEGPDARSALLDAVRAWVAQLLAAGRESGQVAADLPAEVQAAAAYGMLRGLDELALSGRDAPEGPLAAAPLLLLRRMLGAEAPPAASGR